MIQQYAEQRRIVGLQSNLAPQMVRFHVDISFTFFVR
jgi:hypothetical protein